ncbi:hypothetical protein JW935_11425, partial [candidate division KSB1 bacterium]|nr:hypothetical protein [candidate division KSB1 bacterium]
MNCSELAEPQNWVAHGGCWTFTDSGIYAQAGIMGLQLIYYRKDKYANFELIAQVNKLTEGGALGVVFRFDEIKNQGYCYLLYPHGQYGIMLVNKEQDDML